MHEEAKGPPRRRSDDAPERRKARRLPEELEAVIADNAVASALIDQLPPEQRESEIRWVAQGDGRETRARRAVDVVRHAIDPTSGPGVDS
jgi:uncharacterized protein YdeI (YjbR/CyaY-like superfamily)